MGQRQNSYEKADESMKAVFPSHRENFKNNFWGVFFTKTQLAAVLVLMGAALISYTPLWENEFVNYDDDVYITQNPGIQRGLTPETVKWAFTSTQAENWHPVTWLSHSLDYVLWGLQPAGHHLTNLGIHLLTTLLIVLVLFGMTANFWASFLTAAVFALHPLNVESVAWAAERKNLLCGFFWFLTLWAYWRYACRPGWASYLRMILFFLLGLLSKPMMVTLPFALLLLDFWPLGRISLSTGETARSLARKIFPLIFEKGWLFVLAAGSCVITVIAQQNGNAVTSMSGIGFFTRGGNALVQYAAYLGQMFWPAKLSVFYPYSGKVSHAWMPALGLIAGISWVAFRQIRRAPYLPAGWFWFLGTLIPVIGLVQVGEQARADRYMYLPMIGLAMAGVWGIMECVKSRTVFRFPVQLAGGVLFFVWGLLTFHQASVWRSSLALFGHALEVTQNNYVADINYSLALRQSGDGRRAAWHLAKAIRSLEGSIQLFPGHARLYHNLGTAYAMTGQFSKAVSALETGLRLKPADAELWGTLGLARAQLGDYSQAVEAFERSLALNAADYYTQFNLGYALVRVKRPAEAREHFQAALRIAPDNQALRANVEKILKENSR